MSYLWFASVAYHHACYDGRASNHQRYDLSVRQHCIMAKVDRCFMGRRVTRICGVSLAAPQLTSVGLHSTNASVAGAKGGDERWYPNGLKWPDLAPLREAKSINQRPDHQCVLYRAGRRCSRELCTQPRPQCRYGDPDFLNSLVQGVHAFTKQ